MAAAVQTVMGKPIPVWGPLLAEKETAAAVVVAAAAAISSKCCC